MYIETLDTVPMIFHLYLFCISVLSDSSSIPTWYQGKQKVTALSSWPLLSFKWLVLKKVVGCSVHTRKQAINLTSFILARATGNRTKHKMWTGVGGRGQITFISRTLASCTSLLLIYCMYNKESCSSLWEIGNINSREKEKHRRQKKHILYLVISFGSRGSRRINRYNEWAKRTREEVGSFGR